MSTFPLARSAPRTIRLGVLVAVILALLLTTGCGSSGEKTKAAPNISVTIDKQTSTIRPAVYCIDDKAKVYGEQNAADPINVQPGKTISITVPAVVADKTWSVEVWSVSSETGKPIPERLIGEVSAGKARTFAKITTSDAVPDRVYLMVTIPRDPKCDAEGASGIWPILIVRQAAQS